MYNIHIYFTSIINCVMSIHHIHPLSIRHIFTKHFPRYMVQWSFNIFCYEIFGGHNHRFHWTFVAIYPWKLARLLHGNTASSEPENTAKAAATLQPRPSPSPLSSPPLTSWNPRTDHWTSSPLHSSLSLSPSHHHNTVSSMPLTPSSPSSSFVLFLTLFDFLKHETLFSGIQVLLLVFLSLFLSCKWKFVKSNKSDIIYVIYQTNLFRVIHYSYVKCTYLILCQLTIYILLWVDTISYT